MKLNKIVIVVGLIISTTAYSQKTSKEYKFFENKQENNTNSDETAKAPSAPGDSVPINEYIPALAIVGLGMAVYFGRKKIVLTK